MAWGASRSRSLAVVMGSGLIMVSSQLVGHPRSPFRLMWTVRGVCSITQIDKPVCVGYKGLEAGSSHEELDGTTQDVTNT